VQFQSSRLDRLTDSKSHSAHNNRANQNPFVTRKTPRARSAQPAAQHRCRTPSRTVRNESEYVFHALRPRRPRNERHDWRLNSGAPNRSQPASQERDKGLHDQGRKHPKPLQSRNASAPTGNLSTRSKPELALEWLAHSCGESDRQRRWNCVEIQARYSAREQY